MQFRATAADDSAAIEVLLDSCFGGDRHQRTAYRLRRAAAPIVGPTMVVTEGDAIIASVQYWLIALVDYSGAYHALTLLGPIGVIPEARGRGIGVSLINQSLLVADGQHCDPVMLIGDLDYYARFGFGNAATAGWQLPGPVDQFRVLLRNPAQVGLPVLARLFAYADAFNVSARV